MTFTEFAERSPLHVPNDSSCRIAGSSLLVGLPCSSRAGRQFEAGRSRQAERMGREASARGGSQVASRAVGRRFNPQGLPRQGGRTAAWQGEPRRLGHAQAHRTRDHRRHEGHLGRAQLRPDPVQRHRPARLVAWPDSRGAVRAVDAGSRGQSSEVRSQGEADLRDDDTHDDEDQAHCAGSRIQSPDHRAEPDRREGHGGEQDPCGRLLRHRGDEAGPGRRRPLSLDEACL